MDSRATLARIKLIPEPVVRTLETTFTLVKTLVTEGPMAAWEQLKEIASEMKDAFIDAVKDWIKWQLVQKAIETLLTMLIPGLGLIRAIVGIYDTIVFFIQRAKDIMQMISDFLNSIAAIAAGNIGAAAAALEAGLARGLVLVIDFLARFLRLTGVTKKIQEAIQKVRGKVDGVIAKVAGWIVAQARRLGGLVASTVRGGGDATGGGHQSGERVGKTVNFSTRRKSHRLWIEVRGRDARVMVASGTGMNVQDRLSWFEGNLDQRVKDPAQRARVAELIPRARQLARTADADADALVRQHQQPRAQARAQAGRTVSQGERRLEGEEDTLASLLSQLFEIFDISPGPDGSRGNPIWIQWHKPPISEYPQITLKDKDRQDVRIAPTDSHEFSVYPTRVRARAVADARAIREMEQERIAEQRRIQATFGPQLEGAKVEFDTARTALDIVIKNMERVGTPTAYRNQPEYETFRVASKRLKEVRKQLDSAKIRLPGYQYLIAKLDEEIAWLEAPARRQLVRTRTLGVKVPNQTFKGRVLGPRMYSPKEARLMQREFREFLADAGYDWNGKSADHVTDLFVSGPDSFENLWPLSEALNIFPNQSINLATGKQVGVGFADADSSAALVPMRSPVHLHGKHFIIKALP